MTLSLATITPSLGGFFWSLLFGFIVIGGIIGGMVVLSQTDQITRS